METILTYRGRTITSDDVAFIRNLIRQNPGLSRWTLSRGLCAAWNWRQLNGAMKDMVCRGMMLALHRAGHIQLPPIKIRLRNPLVIRRKPDQVTVDDTPVTDVISGLQPVIFQQVRRTPAEKLFNSLLAQYHYLGYTQPVGEHLKYLVYAQNRPIACFSWSSAAKHIGSRDRFIGWPPAKRKAGIHLLAYNSRFLILPWVKVPHLASYLLGKMARRLPVDWESWYHHPICHLETFVDKDRFSGTCYRAANWRYLGDTTGRGKDDQTNRPNRSIKAVWGYPLSNFHLLAAI